MLHYCDSMQRLHERQASVGGNMIRLARWDWPEPEEVRVLERLYAHFEIDRSRHPALCTLAWLLHMGRLLETNVRFDTRVIEHKIRPMMTSLAHLSAP